MSDYKITREEYEDAQNVVWDYEEQLKAEANGADESAEQALNLPVVTPRLFYVVANNDRDDWEQITNGLTLERAKAYKQNDFCKNNWPNAFIVCTFNEG